MKEQKDHYAFVSVFHYEESGISIVFPDLPGCLPCVEGDDVEQAIKNAKEALGLHLFGMEQDHEEIPDPTPAKEIKCETGETLVLVDVFMPPIRDNIEQHLVKKTLSLPAWLAKQAEENGVNCSKLFQNALMSYLNLH